MKYKTYSILMLFLIFLITVIVYIRSFNIPFVLDDRRNIIQNPAIQNLTDLKTIWNYHPTRFVTVLTWSLDYRFGKLNTFNYHLTNFTIHIINVFAVYWLFNLLLKSTLLNERFQKYGLYLPLTAAFLFAIHPIQTETVLYSTQRATSLAAMFYLLTLIFFLKSTYAESLGYKNKSIIFYILSVITLFLSFFSKENSYSLPLAIVLTDILFVPRKNRNISSVLNKKILSYLFIAGCLIIWALKTPGLLIPLKGSVQGIMPRGKTEMTQLDYLLTQINVIRTYIRLLIFPIYQNLDYDYPITGSLFNFQTIFSLFLHILIIAIAILQRKRNRLISYGIIFFYVTLSVESIIPLPDVIKEHTLYLPSVGFFIALTSLFIMFYEMLISKFKEKRLQKDFNTGIILLSILIFLILGFSTFRRILVWQDEVTLWKDVVAKSPRKERPRIQLGVIYLIQGDNQNAKIQFEKLVNENSKSIIPYSDLSVIYTNSDEFQKAQNILEKALKIDYTSQDVWNNLGYMCEKQGNDEKAIQNYQMALKQNSTDSAGKANTLINIGTLLAKQGKWDQAMDYFNKAIETYPNSVKAHYSIGIAYLHFGKLAEAKKEFLETLRIQPNFQQAQIYINKI